MDQFYLNFSFMLASVLSLVLLSRAQDSKGDLFEIESECSDNECEVDTVAAQALPSKKYRQAYSALLKKMERCQKEDFDRMPTFEEMMSESGRRRCYSADDIDALMLIPDKRIKTIFDSALEELLRATDTEDDLTDGRTTPSIKSIGSWDKMDE